MPDNLAKTVFRLRGLPNTVTNLDDVASLLCERLDEIPIHHIHVCSLASTLNIREDPKSKVATVMFETAPSVVQDNLGEDQWSIPHTDFDLILDTHFLGMTPLNDVQPIKHLSELYFALL